MLNELLQYENARLLARYENDFPQAKLSAREVLQELMKYIWLCLRHSADKINQPQNEDLHFQCVMHAEMKDIDNMWHSFLLFTRDYQAFCQKYLNGQFFHHEPSNKNEGAISEEKYALELGRYLSYIYDHLGQETLTTWFEKTHI